MAENSYKGAIDQAVSDIDKIENKLKELATQISTVGELARKNLTALTPKTPQGVDKQLKEVQKVLKDIEAAEKRVGDAMSKRMDLIRDNANKQSIYSKQHIADQKEMLKQTNKAAQILKNQAKEAERVAKAEQAVKAARNESISKQMTGRMVEYVNSIGRTNDELIKMRLYYKEMNTELNKAAQAEDKVKQAREKSLSKEWTGRMRESVDAIGQQSQAMKALNADFKEQERASAKEARDKEKAAQALQKMGGAYNQLVAKQQQAKKVLQDLIASEIASNAEIRKAQKEYDKYTAKVNRANNATQSFAQKGLVGAARGIRDLMSAFGVVGGLFLFANMAKQGFNLARQLDSLNFAMKTVITDANELARTQSFLADITERYGAELVTTTERYTKFLAAAKQSNVTMEDTEKIFGTMTKAAGALGLKTHELEGVYLALEQMLSKGKVTTEELRRQLGERLPGAFGIMADALGVTTSELDDMLRKGEILSSETLPKFADAVEKAYGLDKIDRVENLNAATARLSNSWVTLVGTITKSEGAVSKALIGIIDTASAGINILNEFNKTLEMSFEIGQNSGRSEGLKMLEEDVKNFGGTIEEAANIKLPHWTNMMNKYQAELAKLEKNKGGLGGYIGEWIDGMKINKMAEMVAKYKEMVNVAREAQGLEPLDLFENVDNYDSKNFDHVSSQLKYYETSLERLKKMKEEVSETQSFTPQQEERLDAEIYKVERLVLEYQGLKKLAQSKDDWWSFDDEGSVENTRGTYGTLEYWQNKLTEAQERYKDSTLETKDAISAEMAIYEEKIAQWERGNKKQKEAKEIMDGSVAALEAIKKELQDQQSRLATTTEEWKDLDKAIGGVDARIEHLKNGLESFDLFTLSPKGYDMGELELGEDFLKEQSDLFEESEAMKISIVEGTTDALKKMYGEQLAEAIKAGASEDELDALRSFQEKKLEIIEESLEKQKELQEEFQSAVRDMVVEGGNAIMDARVENVEEDIALNRERYAKILDSQEWSEEQRDAIEAERERKEVELEKKKRKREKEAFLVKQGFALAEIGLNLAKTLSAIDLAVANIMATLPPPFNVAVAGTYKASATSMAIGTAAASAGLVLAQTIPKFETGTDNAPEGIALVDEKRPEVHTDKHGNVKSWGLNKPNLRKLDKGDRIIPSHEAYFKEFGQTDMQRAVWDMNMQSAGQELSQSQVDNSLLREMTGMRNDIDKMGKRIAKLASRPINNNVNVKIQDNKPY